MIKVLHILGRLQRGGAELRTIEAIKESQNGIFKFDFLSISGIAGELDQEVRAHGGDVHYLKRGLSFPWRFYKLLKSKDYQVVHCHLLYFSGYVLKIAKLAGVENRIAHFRNCDPVSTVNPVMWAYYRVGRFFIYKNATWIIGVSRSALSAMWDAYYPTDKRCRVIYNGIQMISNGGSFNRNQLQIGNEDKILLHVGNYRPQKNHLKVISIFSEITKKIGDLHLILVGMGTDQLEPIITKLPEEICARIHIMAHRDDVREIMGVCDVFVFPSLWEGLPGAVLEAACLGLPIVTSDIGPNKEIAGFIRGIKLVKVDAPDAVWADLITVALNTSSRDRDGLKEGFSCSPFSMKRYVNELNEVWTKNP